MPSNRRFQSLVVEGQSNFPNGHFACLREGFGSHVLQVRGDEVERLVRGDIRMTTQPAYEYRGRMPVARQEQGDQ